MRMIQLYTTNRTRTVPYPETGVHDNNGHLFHHAFAYPLLPVHVQRLEEHGIFFKKKRITEEDNEKLRSNWLAFAQEHEMNISDLLSLINFQAGRRLRTKNPESLKKKAFIKNSFFWPKMCNGFPHRTAAAIKNHLRVLFDPINEIEGANDPLNEEEARRAVQMYRKGKTYQEIADHFRKIYHLIEGKIHYLMSKESVSRSERRRLWNIVCESLEVNPRTSDALSQLKINWSAISRILFRNSQTLQSEWKRTVAELSEHCSNGKSWDDAFEMAVPKCENISPSQFADFLDMLIGEKMHMDTLRCTADEKRHLKSEMRKRGISGFKTGRHSEFKFCRQKLGRVFWAIRNNLLEPIRLYLPISAQLSLISRCFRAFVNAPCKVPRVQLRRHLVVNELIRQMSEDDPNWKPSRKLQKYIAQTL